MVRDGLGIPRPKAPLPRRERGSRGDRLVVPICSLPTGPPSERRQAGAYIYYHAVGTGLPVLNLTPRGHGSIPLILAHTRLVERDWERATGRSPLLYWSVVL